MEESSFQTIFYIKYYGYNINYIDWIEKCTSINKYNYRVNLAVAIR